MINAIAASPGIAIGPVLKLNESELKIEKTQVSNIELEVKKLKAAIEAARDDILKIREITFEKLGNEKAQIFDAHLLILEDPEVYNQTVSMIEKQSLSATWSLDQTTKSFISIFESMNDDYMKERASDIRDVFQRVLNHLLGHHIIDLSLLEDNVIIVANDITPSQTATINKDSVIGFLTSQGGKTSHSAIMARTLEIPAVVGASNITEKLEDNDLVIFDGNTGDIFINPTQEVIKRYQDLREKEQQHQRNLKELIGLECKTKDGHKIELAGNIGTIQDIPSLHSNDAQSVGLYRTEFLFMDRSSMPGEQEQYEAYSKIIESLNSKECVIRTLDIGGDKNLPYLNIPKEENPFLGYRAIRIGLDDKEKFKIQLRAILRASAHGKMSIMFPMISSYEELIQAKALLNECKEELLSEAIDFDSAIKVGIMIEVPSAALIADLLAKEVDFFSLGTNDLTQYTCAVDRINPKIEHLYDPFNPGLLRLIKNVAQAANDNGITVSICGSMAHIPELLPFYVSCEITKLSMSPIHILGTKKLILELEKTDCDKITQRILQSPSGQEIRELLTVNK